MTLTVLHLSHHCCRIPGGCVDENLHRWIAVCRFLSWFRGRDQHFFHIVIKPSGWASSYPSPVYPIASALIDLLLIQGIRPLMERSEFWPWHCEVSGVSGWNAASAVPCQCHLAPAHGFLIPTVEMIIIFNPRGMFGTSVTHEWWLWKP